MCYVVIMAGGKGERFWPKSVRKKPKQFHSIVSDRTMIQETFERVVGCGHLGIKEENILIVLGERYEPLLLDQLPHIDKKNIITEPEGKNTAPAIALAAACIEKRSSQATVVVLSADHVIHPRSEFSRALSAALKAAETGHLVTFGIQPDRPATEYGYVELGEPLPGEFEHEVYRVKMFREKPSLETAQEFIKRGTFLWNSGMFAFRLKDMFEALKEYMPSLYHGLRRIHESIDTNREEAVKKAEYEKFENISIDYGIMEKAKNIVCVKSRFRWDDVGSWGALARHRDSDPEGNIIQGNVLTIDSKNSIVLGEDDSLISLIGVNDLIVVKEGNRLLLCHKSQDQRIKEMLKLLTHDKNQNRYL